jgi:hypothetical protein
VTELSDSTSGWTWLLEPILGSTLEPLSEVGGDSLLDSGCTFPHSSFLW